MGRLDDVMASDVDRLTGSTSDLGIATRFIENGTSGDPVTWYAVPGSWEDGLDELGGGYGGRSTHCSFTGALSTLTGFLRDGRQPRYGDKVQVESGAYKGTWTVEEVDPDEGDAVTLRCINRQIVSARREAGGV